ncbi:MAG: pirin family protein [Flavobacteriales bacterium]|nr:pirin family protein [Flavobacteriales bacterium]
MDRKDFLRKSLLSAGAAAVAGPALMQQREGSPRVVGFNHLPSHNPKIMANTILHKANTRGHADHGWLDSHHTFSFANYYDPERMHFGVLRVLNDDRVAPGKGFSTHPHENMEIISIPLEGDLEHKDSMGNVAVIRQGDIQVLTAGTGITHSEFNKNTDKQVRFLQIWVFPSQRRVTPRYAQITLNASERHNKLQQILSPDPTDAGVWIHQNAWFHLGTFDKGFQTHYAVKDKRNGVYAFVLKGDVAVQGIALNQRDGLGLWDTDAVAVVANSPGAELLLMEVPMEVN